MKRISQIKPAELLGYSGLVPLYGCLLMLYFTWPGETGDVVLRTEVLYSAIILAFLGGTRWGIAMMAGPNYQQIGALMLTTLPALVAWLVLFVGPVHQILILMAGFGLAFIADRLIARKGFVPDWYEHMRLSLTLLFEIGLAATLVRILSH
ncbi:MAG: DUF3429 domain-containing protein [Parvibaculum sp.]